MSRFLKIFISIVKYIALGWLIYSSFYFIFLHAGTEKVPQWLAKVTGVFMFIVGISGIIALITYRIKQKS